jgi:hypothetical protein
MNLIGLTYLNIGRFPTGLPHFESVDFRHANHVLRKWRVVIKGPRIYFTGPAEKGKKPETFIAARQLFFERWEGEDIAKTESWSPAAEEKR